MQLESSITKIPKVGPKYKSLLNKLDIYTIEDLIYHFPFRYDDYSVVKKISELAFDEPVSVEGELVDIQNIFTKYRKKLTKAQIRDTTGKVDIVWFNQHYLKNSLELGEMYSISGKVGSFNGKPTFTAPIIEKASGKKINTQRLVPVYPETAGLSSKWLRAKISYLLGLELDYVEFLPTELRSKYQLANIKDSLSNFHFPQNKTEALNGRKRFEFEELFLELLRVEKRKSLWKLDTNGIQINKSYKLDEFNKFVESLPFKLTTSQKGAVEEIFEDLSNYHPMNRLLEGDVGSGKTVVAVAAAYLAYLNGYKTLYMAPTEILAKQHFETFKQFLEPFGVDIQLKTGNAKDADNNFDILIGTHALLYSKEPYENIGLITIDEQHRFGVEQREKIKELTDDQKTPNLLTMTATPIPRTMALTLYGDLSLSALKTVPNIDKKITTRVIGNSKRNEAYKWIADKKEPTFIVCPLIQESESSAFENVKAAETEYEELKSGVFKNRNVGLLHGRMSSKEKNDVVEKFRRGKLDVLVSTPVIEVGIDIPDATIIVIESAERYGLASLHQLRGRVGRGSKEGFCLLFTSTNVSTSIERLKHLESINSGIELAEIDMRMRGQGDVYGTMQHGFKRFKVARLDNLELLEQAKVSAQEYFPKIDEYPELKNKLKQIDEELIANN